MNPWDLLLKALGATMSFFYDIIPNYGFAIIMLTLVVSLLLFPLTLKQTRSMKAMQEIQPEIKRIQKEYKSDREELNKQLLAFYKEHNINPAAGCLPLLVQMPIWFALFRVLRVGEVNGALSHDYIPSGGLADAIIAHKTSFVGMDLLVSPNQAAANGIVHALPYIFLVALVVVTGIVQSWQMTRRRKAQDDGKKKEESKQAQQMQTITKFMPLLMGVFSWGFPTGLVLYFVTSNLFRIGQQSLIFRIDEGGSGAERQGSSGGSKPGDGSNGDEPPRRTRPSPNASKKRKRRRR
jgi:YidC/Oxa1 family membrane protein insertase